MLLFLFVCAASGLVVIPAGLRVLHANIGNLDEESHIFGACPPGEPYRGGLCSLAQEQVLAKHIAAHRPNIVTLVEVVSARECAKDASWCPPGSGAYPSDASCCGKNALAQREQVLRILPPEMNWTVSCDTNDGHACIGVRSDNGVEVTIDGCAGAQVCNSTTPAPPRRTCDFLDPPADLRSDVSWVGLRVAGQAVRYVVAHPFAVGKDTTQWPCVADEYAQAFTHDPDSCVLLSGDWNSDCYRFPETLLPACEVWSKYVASGSSRYAAVYHTTPKGRPLPTWGVPLPLFSYDFFLHDKSNCALPPGFNCVVLGVSPNTTRVDSPLDQFDHKALLCTTDQ
jgi:hypothetical protein